MVSPRLSVDGLTGEVTTLRGDHTHLCKSLENAPDDVTDRFKGEFSAFVSDFLLGLWYSKGVKIISRN